MSHVEVCTTNPMIHLNKYEQHLVPPKEEGTDDDSKQDIETKANISEIIATDISFLPADTSSDLANLPQLDPPLQVGTPIPTREGKRTRASSSLGRPPTKRQRSSSNTSSLSSEDTLEKYSPDDFRSELAGVYFHVPKKEWRAVIGRGNRRQQKTFSIRKYGFDEAKQHAEYFRKQFEVAGCVFDSRRTAATPTTTRRRRPATKSIADVKSESPPEQITRVTWDDIMIGQDLLSSGADEMYDYEEASPESVFTTFTTPPYILRASQIKGKQPIEVSNSEEDQNMEYGDITDGTEKAYRVSSAADQILLQNLIYGTTGAANLMLDVLQALIADSLTETGDFQTMDIETASAQATDSKSAPDVVKL